MHRLSRSCSRRTFLRVGSVLGGGWSLAGWAGPALARSGPVPARVRVGQLPTGAAPPPVAFPHFPDRLHAFVWRNWPLVPVDRLAKVVGAKTSDIVRLGKAMGLGEPPGLAGERLSRCHLTVIRRNWHLLPYEQLLQLLDWTPEQLAYTLREDDFLYIKLGSLKPQCEPLRYRPPDAAVQAREREIAGIVQECFGPRPGEAQDPLFGFVDRLSQAPAPARDPVGGAGLRFCYSYFAPYGDPLLESADRLYPEGYLARLAQTGVNGVWLPAVLCKLAPFPWEPGRSAHYKTRLAHLRKLVARARRHGLRVFLYLNEPRALPRSFFENRPELRGIVEGDHATLCTSVPEVRDYLAGSVAGVARAVPGLGGFFSITASENLTHCWSHGGGAGCPRCSLRPPAEVVAEVNQLFQEGIRRAGTGAQMIAWDWGWNDAWALDVIRRLPAEVAVMSVSEWSLGIERGGVKTEVGEYSISAVGPGPRALRHWQSARQRGLKTLAKIQAGNTWELSAVPYVPAVENVARHAERLRAAGVHDLMLGWTLGGYPSPNLEVVAETLAGRAPDAAMHRVAERRFGPALAPAVVTAWRGFSTAFCEFPYHIGVLYSGPQQLGPANLLWETPTGYRATMVGFPYDDLPAWRAVYPPDVFIRQLEKVAEGFDQALDQLRKTAAGLPAPAPAQRRVFEDECGVAEAASLHFRSAANQARFILTRAAIAAAGRPGDAAPHRTQRDRVLQNEIALARRLYALQQRDSRLGFEASNQYYYVPLDLVEKVLNCRALLAGPS